MTTTTPCFYTGSAQDGARGIPCKTCGRSWEAHYGGIKIAEPKRTRRKK